MKKEEIKSRLLEAVKRDEHVEDIKTVAIFGSFARGEDHPDSDVDVLMQFAEDSHIGFFTYAEIQRNLTEAVGIKVDLVTPEALSKYIRKDVLEQAEMVYER
jgi:predicted nucleotidyltransferase